MADEVTPIELPDGTVIEARISHAEQLATGIGEYTDTGFQEAFTARLEGLTDLVRGVGTTLREATAAVAPDEVSVAFGVELAAKAGKVVSVLADAEAKASVVVTLTWQDRRRNGGSPEEAPDGDGRA